MDNKEARAWSDKQDKAMDKGMLLVKKASEDALSYTQDAIENMHDPAWRRMVIETQAVEIGVGKALAEHVVPLVYNDMPKKLRRKLKVNKDIAQVLREIYIGKLIKNIKKELK